MSRDTVLCLCDLSGVMASPWVAAGYRAVLVDPQHGVDSDDGRVLRLAKTVEDAMPVIRDLITDGRIVFVASFPPCTDMAVSGARWFRSKHEADPLFQAKAVQVAEQCRTVGRLSGAPWFVENPISVLSNCFGKPQHIFEPWWFTGLCPDDNYRKSTCLWTGGGFRMPPKTVDYSLGDPDDRIHKAPPSSERANFRSKTPLGFATAVYREMSR
ncbi:hypothetical protein [Bifidobacterium crudilactis]|jgi:hypothetical protein|uniref:hypothetical protein n=1 Tax=Bifidobacterium crudilactis TaxID=327277 RepID=UPI002F35298C|nr:hypothetical protein [Bifidobacterium crudilactis]MCI1664642.1 hypothetical protein [Bifidobacterium crudilactis]